MLNKVEKGLAEDQEIIVMSVVVFRIYTARWRSINIMLKRNGNSNQNYNSKIPFVILYNSRRY